MRKPMTCFLIMVIVGVTFVYGGPASAATINVTTTADARADDDVCSLREAIIAANQNSNTHEDDCTAGVLGETDVIDLPAGLYDIELGPVGDDAALNGDLDITDDVIIRGAGPSETSLSNTVVVVDFFLPDRAFHVIDANVDLKGIGVRGGSATTTAAGSTGGGVLVEQGSSLDLVSSALVLNIALFGGGMHVDSTSTATIRKSTIQNNVSNSAGAGVNTEGNLTIIESTFNANDATQRGGAIHSPSGFGPLVTIRRSALYDNEASVGGAIYMHGGSGSELILENSTISGNRAERYSDCCVPRAGAIYHNGKSTIIGSTIVGNTAEDYAGIQVDSYASSDMDIKDSILANNFETVGTEEPSNCTGSVESLGGNIEYPDYEFCLVSPQPSDQHVDPLLGPLADNGGPTLTHALPKTSPAVGAAEGCLGVDQRGAPRKAPCDSGAYELVLCAGAIVDRIGTGGPDDLNGDATPNGILGLGGNDSLSGNEEADGACGGAGKDKAFGGPGGDGLVGQGDADTLAGQGGGDKLLGGPAADILKGGPGDDTCTGGPGKDVLKSC